MKYNILFDKPGPTQSVNRVAFCKSLSQTKKENHPASYNIGLILEFHYTDKILKIYLQL
jgi:hypothetical protein